MVFQIFFQIILSPNTCSHLALHNTSVFVFVGIAVYNSFAVAFCTSVRILSFCNRKMVSNSPFVFQNAKPLSREIILNLMVMSSEYSVGY